MWNFASIQIHSSFILTIHDCLLFTFQFVFRSLVIKLPTILLKFPHFQSRYILKM